MHTLEDVSKHTSSNDLWMILRGGVYDVTEILSTHPGGTEVLFDCAGVDATAAYDDVPHSDHAWNILKPWYIGELTDEDKKRLLEKTRMSSSWRKRSRKRVRKVETRSDFLAEKESVDKGSVAFLLLIALGMFALFCYLHLLKWHTV